MEEVTSAKVESRRAPPEKLESWLDLCKGMCVW